MIGILGFSKELLFRRGRVIGNLERRRYCQIQILTKNRHDLHNYHHRRRSSSLCLTSTVYGLGRTAFDPLLRRNRYLQFSSSSVQEEDSGGMNIEEQYSKKTPLEHVLLRPGMYVGPNERLPPQKYWVAEPTQVDESFTYYNNGQPSSFQLVSKEYGLVPALIKIFDEILVNASDNRLRHPESCTRLDVTIEPGSEDQPPLIKVFNNGQGIPVEIHRGENMYLPEMLFGHLLTGSNFDDNKKRVTGGRHGYGAKLTNIFSKQFTVETLDSRRMRRYKQSWYNNMHVTGEAEIEHLKSPQDDYTCISFTPDMPIVTGDQNAAFIDPRDYAVMCRRVIDVAGCAGSDLKVTLNGVDVSCSSFSDYISLYRQPDAKEVLFDKISPRLTVGIGLSDKHSFESVSFVNSIATSRGGTHVNVVVNQVVKKVQEHVSKIEPDLAGVINPSLIRRHFFVAVNSLIENPTFDSQMKESLTTHPGAFGTSYTLSNRYLNKLVVPEIEGGPGIVEAILRAAKGQQQAILIKQVGGIKSRRTLLSIPKLEDAHSAGSDSSMDCTLILTEGDSAKALAVAGLELLGRNYYGVFPLRGKFINVRHINIDRLANNAEVKALISILGLDFEKTYETKEERSTLRYGQVMLMTDQDTDGSHIKGLVINFFRHFWPNLLKPAVDENSEQQAFLSSFITPLLKASKKRGKEVHSFFSMTDYVAWRSSLSDSDFRNWKIKYYKGLGTSTPAEAKEYFSAFDMHRIPFYWSSESDGEMLDKVFDKTRAADRREWISTTYDAEATLFGDDERDTAVSYSDFINKEMIHFSNADNIRSLPSAIDGLKPSQRKVLYACFKRKLTEEIKVAQLCGYCAEHTAYHHGEASLQATIIGMAQDFVGSNNINLLVPSGQFGTRLAGGADAASPRYIFTYLSPITRLLFREEDDLLLEYLEDDGQVIEPTSFYPILPLLLINGTQGIGTGWSTCIPPHDPRSVLDYIKAKIRGDANLPEIRPYVRGFQGSIQPTEDGKGYVSFGRARRLDKRTVMIDELPVGAWTNAYKQKLINMRDKGSIADFVEDHTTTKVSFKVKAKPIQISRMEKTGFESSFKLSTKMSLQNMNAFDINGNIQKFFSVEELADAFFDARLALYKDRKSVLQSEMEYAANVMRNKARFIQSVVVGKIDLLSGKSTKEQTTMKLRDLGFASEQDLQTIRENNTVRRRRDRHAKIAVREAVSVEGITSGFDYLLRMPLGSLTAERIEDLEGDALKKENDLQVIKAKKPEDLWEDDLEELSPHL